MKRFLRASSEVSCSILLEPTGNWGFACEHIKTRCWPLYREISRLGTFSSGQCSPLWRVEGGQKDERMRCRSEKYASQNIRNLNRDYMAAVEPNSVWTCRIDNHAGLVSRDSDYELTPEMPFFFAPDKNASVLLSTSVTAKICRVMNKVGALGLKIELKNYLDEELNVKNEYKSLNVIGPRCDPWCTQYFFPALFWGFC